MAISLRLPKPTRRTLAASLVVATLAAFGTVTAAGLFRKKSNPNEIVRNGLMVLASDLDLGEVYYTDTLEHTFTVHNVTDKPIEITGWNTSCNCTVVEPKQIVIPAHSALLVKGQVNLPKAFANKSIHEAQKISIIYSPRTTTYPQGIIATQKNGWRADVLVEPLFSGSRNFYLGRADIQNVDIVEKSISLVHDSCIRIASVTSDSPMFRLEVDSVYDTRSTIILRVRKPTCHGEYSTVARIEAISSKNGMCYYATLAITIDFVE